MQPATIVTNVGSTVVLRANATGAEPLRYQWQFKGADVSGATGATLTLVNLTVADSGVYRVVVSNAGGTSSADASVTVIGVPEVTVQPATIVTNVGSTVVLSASATGTEPLHYQWQFKGADVSGATGTTLTLANLTVADSGVYRVVVSNAGGTSSADASVTVIGVPEVTVQPATIVTNVGSTVVLSASATGAEPLRYQWQFKGADVSGATGTTLTLANLTVAHSGVYRVVVSNAGGTSSAEASLTVAYPAGAVSELPAIFTNLVSFTVRIVVTPPGGTSLYAVQDAPPPGWGVSEVSGDGSYVGGKVRWVFSDDVARDLTYVVTAPSWATGTNAFSGKVSFDGNDEIPITGERTCQNEAVSLNASTVTIFEETYFQLAVNGKSGSTFHILVADSLAQPIQWRTNATITLTGPVKYWVDPEPPNRAGRFYRIQAKP